MLTSFRLQTSRSRKVSGESIAEQTIVLERTTSGEGKTNNPRQEEGPERRSPTGRGKHTCEKGVRPWIHLEEHAVITDPSAFICRTARATLGREHLTNARLMKRRPSIQAQSTIVASWLDTISSPTELKWCLAPVTLALLHVHPPDPTSSPRGGLDTRTATRRSTCTLRNTTGNHEIRRLLVDVPAN
jgi:hypothetical protein